MLTFSRSESSIADRGQRERDAESQNTNTNTKTPTLTPTKNTNTRKLKFHWITNPDQQLTSRISATPGREKTETHPELNRSTWRVFPTGPKNWQIMVRSCVRPGTDSINLASLPTLHFTRWERSLTICTIKANITPTEKFLYRGRKKLRFSKISVMIPLDLGRRIGFKEVASFVRELRNDFC